MRLHPLPSHTTHHINYIIINAIITPNLYINIYYSIK